MKGISVRCPAPWRWILFIAFGFGLSVAPGFAQTLAELAKKEKERRAKTPGSTRVITDQELRSRARLPPSIGASTTTGESESEAGSEGQEGEEPDETRTREYWQGRVEAINKKIQDIEEQLESPEMSWSGGIRTDVNPLGQRNLSRRQELEQQLAQARAELVAIQDEARRAGVPSSWVR